MTLTFRDIAARLDELAIEVPSWAYGNSGTRFKVFGSPGTPRTVQEKIADAAAVHRFTGLAPTVALHIPWDRVVETESVLKGMGAAVELRRYPGVPHTVVDDEIDACRELIRGIGSGARR